MRRLDAELVSRGLVRSRGEAQVAIDERRVKIDGMVAIKAATGVSPASNVIVEAGGDTYVSRGAHKLIGALKVFPISFLDRDVLDAGASTGGFTQVALEAGAQAVLAVDVGYGQIAWSLRTDPRGARDGTPEHSLFGTGSSAIYPADRGGGLIIYFIDNGDSSPHLLD